MNYDKVFNSSKNNSESFELATGHISTTVIFCEEEKLFVKITAKGTVDFFGAEDNLLESVTLPAQTGGREIYDEVVASVAEGCLVMKFPVVEWIDNYPHCDGEHDRWDRRVIEYNTVSFKIS